ncbi:MAG: SRPBCC family protein [Nocardioides sp.]
MELTHRFSVPTPVAETWQHFNDIASVAECFPGAQVTGVEGDTFTGSAKVKLGPIALVYNGSGSFLEKDEAGHRFVLEAKGKDKRGNGTAGATIKVNMADSATGGTDLEVLTDLAITGKPAQFGRGVMQDVSDKLLGQFVACLGERLAGAADVAGTPADAATPNGDTGPQAASAAASSAGDSAAAASSGTSSAGAASGAPRPTPSAAADDNALDLGATVLPVLLKSYGKQIAGALAGLVLLRMLFKRVRRNR